MKQDTQNGIKRVNVNIDWIQVFVIINNVGMKINSSMTAKKLIDKGVFSKEFVWNSSKCV